jgi:GNAT superfamily N-acetyltransferase
VTRVEIRRLDADDLGLIGEIDRSEIVDTAYRVVEDRLETYPVEWDVPPWSREGVGDHSVAGLVGFLRPVLDRGGVYLGAFHGGEVAGVAVVEERFEDTMAWLTFLHVSSPYRRRGVATALWDVSAGLARRAGATTMYVSATPSGSAVGFYLSKGCALADPPHPALLALEPEDVHLVARL